MQEEDKVAKKNFQPKSTLVPAKKTGLGLKVDTRGSKPLFRWNVIRSKAEGPSTRSHSAYFMYNGWYSFSYL